MISRTKCFRAGQYLLARLAEKYGSEMLLPHLIELLAADCKLRERSRIAIFERCGAVFTDVGSPQPPDRKVGLNVLSEKDRRMSGIAGKSMFHVCKLLVTFADEIGNIEKIQGTGFWVEKDGAKIFVTNAHNVDAKLKFGESTALRPYEISIVLRFQFKQTWQPATRAFKLRSFDISQHPTADVTAIKNILFDDDLQHYHISHFEFVDIAPQDFLMNSLSPMDTASFVGYPGAKGIPWYDEQWQLAIARSVTLASFPGLAFTNRNIATSDTMLVSGFSFSGSSGSPVVSHEKGIQLGEGLTGGAYVPPKLIGIMSGHWREQVVDAFLHTGLSYLTRSTALLEIC